MQSAPEKTGETPKDYLTGPYYLAGYELPAPLLNAAGSINGTSKENIIREVEDLLAANIGAITFGSITIRPNEGLGAWYFDSEMHNRMLLPNIGLPQGKKLISKLASRTRHAGVPLIVSGAPVMNWKLGTSSDQIKKLASELLSTKADLVELDVSCRNLQLAGGWQEPSMAHNLYRMTQLVEDLEKEVGYTNRLGIKLPSYLDKSAGGWGISISDSHDEVERPLIPELSKLFRARRVFRYIVTSNSLGNQIPLRAQARQVFKDFPDNSAGLSGPSQRVKIIARQQLDKWTNQFEDDEQMDVVSAQGVDSGREMAYRLRLGAAAVEGVSFLWRTDKMKGNQAMTWGERVTEMLEEFDRAVNGEAEPQAS